MPLFGGKASANALTILIEPAEVREFVTIKGLGQISVNDPAADFYLEFADGFKFGKLETEGIAGEYEVEGVTHYRVIMDQKRKVTFKFKDYLLPGELDFTALKIFELDPPELDRVLGALQLRFPDPNERLRAIAEMYLGASYYTEPFEDEQTDWLPYRKTNCTMFVLYSTAFLNSSTYDEALEHMRQLHYRQGIVDFANRYHFTSDRITEPSNIYFTDVTEQYVVDLNHLAEVTLTLNVKSNGEYLFGDRLGDWRREVTVKYLPSKGFQPEMLKELPGPLGVAFIKRSNWPLGVIVGHEGILIDGDLYHSGSVRTGLHLVKDYLSQGFSGSEWEGLLLFTLNDVSKPARQISK